MDAEAYLKDLSASRLRVARLAEDRFRATAMVAAMTEVRGAADALVAAGLVEADVTSDFLRRLHAETEAELLADGLVEQVSASAAARLTVLPEVRNRE